MDQNSLRSCYMILTKTQTYKEKGFVGDRNEDVAESNIGVTRSGKYRTNEFLFTAVEIDGANLDQNFHVWGRHSKALKYWNGGSVATFDSRSCKRDA